MCKTQNAKMETDECKNAKGVNVKKRKTLRYKKCVTRKM